MPTNVAGASVQTRADPDPEDLRFAGHQSLQATNLPPDIAAYPARLLGARNSRLMTDAMSNHLIPILDARWRRTDYGR
jgi:hypothetical protein